MRHQGRRWISLCIGSAKCQVLTMSTKFPKTWKKTTVNTKAPQRQGDPNVQGLRKQATISHPQLTAASHIFCLTEHKSGILGHSVGLNRLRRKHNRASNWSWRRLVRAARAARGWARIRSGGVGVVEGGGEDAAAHPGQHPPHPRRGL